MYLVDSLIFHGVIKFTFSTKNLKELIKFFGLWKRKETYIVLDERQP